jgi:hypothetical protein
MVWFVANATALANRFRAFVLIVHDVGLPDDKRLRGRLSLIGALDAAILCGRKQGALSTTPTLQKLNDDEADIAFTARLTKVVVSRDEDGDDVSTLATPGQGTRSMSNINRHSGQALLCSACHQTPARFALMPTDALGAAVAPGEGDGLHVKILQRCGSTCLRASDRRRR